MLLVPPQLGRTLLKGTALIGYTGEKCMGLALFFFKLLIKIEIVHLTTMYLLGRIAVGDYLGPSINDVSSDFFNPPSHMSSHFY